MSNKSAFPPDSPAHFFRRAGSIAAKINPNSSNPVGGSYAGNPNTQDLKTLTPGTLVKFFRDGRVLEGVVTVGPKSDGTRGIMAISYEVKTAAGSDFIVPAVKLITFTRPVAK